MPCPISRCQMRLAMVRVKRPFSGWVTSPASCSRRRSFGAAGAVPPSAGEKKGGRGNQLPSEAVVGLVLQQRAVEPGGDLLPAAVDVAGPGVVVAEQVVPEDEPVLGVGAALREQPGDEPGVGRGVNG